MAASISSHVPCSESWEVKEKMKTSDLCSESQDAEKQNEERAEKNAAEKLTQLRALWGGNK